MINIFKSRWFKFVLRTLIDWIVFVLILVIIGSIRSCIEPLDINYDSDYYKRQQIEEMKRYLDITEMRTYIDKKYNAQLFYPDTRDRYSVTLSSRSKNVSTHK